MKWECLSKFLKIIISRLDEMSLIVAEIEHYIIHKRPLSAEGLKWKRYLKLAVGVLLRLYLICLAMVPVLFLLATEETAYSDTATTADIVVYATPLIVPIVTTDSGATSITEISARLRGEVTDTGNQDPDIWVFWGESDGGEAPGSWDDNVSLGSLGLGSFYHDIGSLSPDTLYYYQVRATNDAGTDWADGSANFTTLLEGSTINPPDDFTAVDLGAITIEFNWTKGYGANYTMVRGARDDYPASITEGELIYYGEAENTTSSGYALDVTKYKFSAWGFWSDNESHSADYAIVSIGGEGMTDIADALEGVSEAIGGFNMAPFMAIAMMIPLIFFTWLTIKIDSEWGSPILAFNTGGLSFILGINAPNIINGSYETSTFGLTLAVVLIVYSLLCVIWSWSMMFKGRRE